MNELKDDPPQKREMSLEEFLEALREVAPEFQWIRRGTVIRAQGGYRCPIEAVAVKKLELARNEDYGAHLLGPKLGLSDETVHKIVRAADSRCSGQSALRAEMLRICGLVEWQPAAEWNQSLTSEK